MHSSPPIKRKTSTWPCFFVEVVRPCNLWEINRQLWHSALKLVQLQLFFSQSLKSFSCHGSFPPIPPSPPIHKKLSALFLRLLHPHSTLCIGICLIDCITFFLTKWISANLWEINQQLWHSALKLMHLQRILLEKDHWSIIVKAKPGPKWVCSFTFAFLKPF